MKYITRILALLLLAASLGALAQGPVPVDDETLFQEIDGAIHRNAALGHAHITVRARDGFVTLSGFARTMEDVALAGSLAWRTRGVTGVHNEIRVSSQPSRALRPPAPSERAVTSVT